MTVEKGYTLKNKAKRNQAIRDYKKVNPEASLAEMKEIFGISMARISVILKAVSHD